MKRQAILTKSVGTKVSEAELALLEARAKSTGLTLSTWMRRSLLAAPIEATSMSAKSRWPRCWPFEQFLST